MDTHSFRLSRPSSSLASTVPDLSHSFMKRNCTRSVVHVVRIVASLVRNGCRYRCEGRSEPHYLINDDTPAVVRAKNRGREFSTPIKPKLVNVGHRLAQQAVAYYALTTFLERERQAIESHEGSRVLRIAGFENILYSSLRPRSY